MNATPSNSAAAARAQAADPAHQEAFDIGFESFLWGYPYVKTMLLKNEATNPASANHAPFNQFRCFDTLAKPGFHDFTPTVELLMNVAWLDMSQGPVLLHVPAIEGRYWSVQVTDSAGNSMEYLGSRLGTAAGTYAYVPKGWRGALPRGVRGIEVSSRFAQILARALVRPTLPGDVAEGARLNRLVRLETLNPAASFATLPADQAPVSAKPSSPVFNSLDFFAALNAAIAEGGLLPGEETIAAKFAGLGIGPGCRFDRAALSEAQRNGLQEGLRAASEKLAESMLGTAERFGTWFFNYKVGIYGDDHLTRSLAACFGYGAMVPQEALYGFAMTDEQGAPLSGERRYSIRFEADAFPPVGAFWSITLYSRPDNQLVVNPIDRYSVSSETAGLHYAKDGSMTIHLRHAAPQGEAAANWLPAPVGAFWLILRTYVPQAPLLDHRYTPPAVVRAV